MKHPSVPGRPPLIGAAPEAPLVVPDEPHAMTWADLPLGLRAGLSAMPVEDWENAIVVHCGSDFAKDAIRLLGAFAHYWVESRRAEDYPEDRMTGPEREQFRERAELALKEIAAVTIELGGRARLIEDLQEDRRFLARLAPESWKAVWTKAMARAVPADRRWPAAKAKPAAPRAMSPPLIQAALPAA